METKSIMIAGAGGQGKADALEKCIKPQFPDINKKAFELGENV